MRRSVSSRISWSRLPVGVSWWSSHTSMRRALRRRDVAVVGEEALDHLAGSHELLIIVGDHLGLPDVADRAHGRAADLADALG